MEDAKFVIEDHGVIEGPLTSAQSQYVEDYGIVNTQGLDFHYKLEGRSVDHQVLLEAASVQKAKLAELIEARETEAVLTEPVLDGPGVIESARKAAKARRHSVRAQHRSARRGISHDLNNLRDFANYGDGDAIIEWDQSAA